MLYSQAWKEEINELREVRDSQKNLAFANDVQSADKQLDYGTEAKYLVTKGQLSC